jgi:hypothetical protein
LRRFHEEAWGTAASDATCRFSNLGIIAVATLLFSGTINAWVLVGGMLLHITCEQVKELYYQNPQFGFYFLQLTARRLFENISSLERDLGAFRTAKHINPV